MFICACDFQPCDIAEGRVCGQAMTDTEYLQCKYAILEDEVMASSSDSFDE